MLVILRLSPNLVATKSRVALRPNLRCGRSSLSSWLNRRAGAPSVRGTLAQTGPHDLLYVFTPTGSKTEIPYTREAKVVGKEDCRKGGGGYDGGMEDTRERGKGEGEDARIEGSGVRGLRPETPTVDGTTWEMGDDVRRLMVGLPQNES